jgi:hypothetical protein
VSFGDEPYHYPYAMTVGTTAVFGGGSTSCQGEFGMGIGLYPATKITGHQGMNVEQDDLAIQFEGPPVAKVVLDWATQFPCGGGVGNVSGRSWFTFFPDGRINRGDQVTLPSQLDAAICTCGASGNWFITSFLTANRDVVETVFGATLPTSETAAGNPAQPTACFNGFNNRFQFALGWRTGRSVRVRTPTITANPTISFVYDLIDGGTTSMYGPGTIEGQTTWWVSTTSNCASLRNLVEPYADNSPQSLPTLTVRPGNAIAVPMGVALDGIFGGENGAGSMGYNSSDPVIRLTTATPLRGFAFWLALDSTEEIESVTKGPAMPAGTWYAQQKRVGNNHRLFWFPDGLEPGETITITTK